MEQTHTQSQNKTKQRRKAAPGGAGRCLLDFTLSEKARPNAPPSPSYHHQRRLQRVPQGSPSSFLNSAVNTPSWCSRSVLKYNWFIPFSCFTAFLYAKLNLRQTQSLSAREPCPLFCHGFTHALPSTWSIHTPSPPRAQTSPPQSFTNYHR